MPITVLDQKTNTTHQFPDDFTDADISAALAQEDAAPKPMASHGPAEPNRSFSSKVGSALPTVLGTAGGLLGKVPVVGAGLSYIGGAGGEGFRQAIEAEQALLNPGSQDIDLPDSFMGQMSAINKAGMTQAAGDLVGRGLGKAILEPVARGVMRTAVGTKALLKEFPDLIPTMIRERLPVGKIPGFAGGSEQAAMRRKASSATTDEILTDAGRAGHTIDPRSVTGTAQQRLTRMGDAPVGEPSQITLSRLKQQFLYEHPNAMSPMEAKSMKEIAQSEAAPVLKAEREGQYVPTSARLKAQFNRDVAGELRSGLENMGPRAGRQFGREVAASESRTQNLIGAQRGIEEAETRPFSFNPWEMRNLTALGLGGGAAAYEGDPYRLPEYIIAARGLSSPRVLSRAALAMTAPITKALAGRGVVSLGQLLSSHEK